MYLAYWQLDRPAFENTPDPQFFYLSRDHEEALCRLSYAIQNRKEAAMLTGEVGCGKSLICQSLIKSLPVETYNVAYISNPKYPPLDFLQALLFHLGFEHEIPGKKMQIVAALKKKIREEAEKGRHTVLIVDEAHTMDAEALEETRLLLNDQLPDRFIVTLVLVGQSSLKEPVGQNSPLDQRVFLRYHLPALSAEDTARYIAFRLERAGLKGNVFDDAAKERIYEVSGGIPRRINIICALCLLVGQGARVNKIGSNIVNLVIE